ncbi:MAG: DUF2461 domain-containing protein [Hymenobacteraceae bacterium]|nr:DUF2461 domain-containing protein [Hymenobacteraceae bacterium]
MKKSIEKPTIQFLADLVENNNREWFEQNKKRYDVARKDFLNFVDALIPGIAGFDEAAKDQKAKDTVFRIYRDIRFSNDKTPYKNHFGSYIAEGGRKSIKPGYYLHISPGNKSFIAGGLWMPPAPELKAARQEIDYNWEEFKGIIEDPSFKKLFNGVEGEKLKTTPKGYDADNPAIEMLRYKSWNVSHTFTDKEVTSDDFLEKCLEIFEAMKPFNDFLKRAIEDVTV